MPTARVSLPSETVRRGADAGWRWIWALLALLVGVRLLLLAWWPLMDTTEARYADIARRMWTQDDWVTPWFDDGVPFWGKPPLSFWITRLGFAVLGLNEWAARLPHFLCMVGVVALTASLAGTRSALQARLVWVVAGSTLVVLTAGGAVQTDAPLVLGITLAMVAAWRVLGATAASDAMAGAAQPVHAAWRWLFFVGLAIGVLAKGPLALVLVGLAGVPWLLLTGRVRRAWQQLPWFRGSLLFAALVLPWFVWAEQRTPGFLEYFLVGEHIHRFTQPGWTGDRYGTAHHEPLGQIWLFALAGLWPWSVLLAGVAMWLGWRRFRGLAVSLPQHVDAIAPTAQRADDTAWTRFAWAWTLAPLVFFTPAHNTLWMYVLPAAPGAALLAAIWMERHLAQRNLQRLLLAGLSLALLATLAFVYFGWEQKQTRSSRELVAQVQALDGETLPWWVVGRRPFSASFYTRGRAEGVPDWATLAQRLAALKSPVIVVAQLAPEAKGQAVKGRAAEGVIVDRLPLLPGELPQGLVVQRLTRSGALVAWRVSPAP